MYDNYNYPCGADTPDAPWNRELAPEYTFYVNSNVTLTKYAKVTTDDYILDLEGGEIDRCTDDTDWNAAFYRNYYSIPYLLDELKKRAERELEIAEPQTRQYYYLQKLVESCSGWEISEETFEE